MAECPFCGTRYAATREDWVTCLRCSGAPRDTRWLHKSYHRVREGADEDELLETAGYLVDFGEAEWADGDGWPHQLELDE